MISSVVEQYLDMVEVTGSNPVSCTIFYIKNKNYFYKWVRFTACNEDSSHSNNYVHGPYGSHACMCMWSCSFIPRGF